MDYSDQLSEEIKMLEAMMDDEFKSLDTLVATATGCMFKSGTMNVVDNNLDFFGLKVGQPVDYSNESDVESANASGGRLPGGS